jgi:ubiquitin C-terminal hydrolase
MFSNDDHLNGRKADEAEEEDADQETPQPKESETPTPAEAAGGPPDATSKPKS